MISDVELVQYLLIANNLHLCFHCGEAVRVGDVHTCSSTHSMFKEDPSTIIADSREKVPHPYPTKALPAGDYLITTAAGMTILVERKNYSDLTGSFLDSRLQMQLWRMGDRADRVVLLIEKGYVPKKIMKHLKSALSYVRKRVEPLMFVAYTEDHAATLKELERWRDNGDHIFVVHRPVEKAGNSTAFLRVLPGIGEVTRDRILESHRFDGILDFLTRLDEAEDLISKPAMRKLHALLDEDWK